MSTLDMNHPLLRALVPACQGLRGTEGQVVVRQDKVLSFTTARRFGKTYSTMMCMFLAEQAGIKLRFAADWVRKEYEQKWRPGFLQQALLLKLQPLAKQVYQRRIERVSKAIVDIGGVPNVLADITASYQVEPPDPHMNNAIALQEWLDTQISNRKRSCCVQTKRIVYSNVQCSDTFREKPNNMFKL